jgi:hypothetical protein
MAAQYGPGFRYPVFYHLSQPAKSRAAGAIRANIPVIPGVFLRIFYISEKFKKSGFSIDEKIGWNEKFV